MANRAAIELTANELVLLGAGIGMLASARAENVESLTAIVAYAVAFGDERFDTAQYRELQRKLTAAAKILGVEVEVVA